MSSGTTAGGPSPSEAAQSQGSVTVTFTWNRAPNDPNDKPPVHILVKQSASTTWQGNFSPGGPPPQTWSFSGTVNDGFGDPVSVDNGDKAGSGKCSGVRVVQKSSPQDYSADGQDPITFTMPAVSLNAQMNGSSSMGSLTGNVSVFLVDKDYMWHPHPVNYHQTSGTDMGNGTIYFTYAWDSSDGVLADLNKCTVGEWVTYNGNPGKYGTDWSGNPGPTGTYWNGVQWAAYFPLYPPYSPSSYFRVPELKPVPWGPATVGQATDTHSPLNVSQQPPPWPTTDVVINAQQVYGFHCTDCMSDPAEFQTLLAGLVITRTMH